MAVTSADIGAITFGKAPFGRRGYDEEQVDAFLNEVQRTLASLESAPGGGVGSTAEPAILATLQHIEQRLDRIEASVALSVPRTTPPDPLYGGT
jgi:DivIVA domain-containing protein